MCEDNATPQEQSYFSQLRSRVTLSFNRSLGDYNAMRPHIERLAIQNTAYRGAVIEGASSMITNRVNAAYLLYQSPMAFYHAGLSGYHWAYYFARNNDLNSDVYHAGMSALYSHLWPWSLTGLATVAATGFDVSRGGARELEEHVRTRYEQQRNALVVSASLSMGVTQIFRRVGTVVQTDRQRLMVRSAMRSWQITGLVAFCYGLSRLHNSMEESGEFGVHLRERRDAFVSGNPSPTQLEFEEPMKESVVTRKQ